MEASQKTSRSRPRVASRYSVKLEIIGVLATMCILGVLATVQKAGVFAVKQAEMSSTAHRDEKKVIAMYGGIYKDQQGLIDWLQRTADRLIAASDRPDLQFGMAILNSPAINAFAFPSGQLYVTRGLLLLANDPSELAAVLAHEIAHITASHAAIRFDLARRPVEIEAGKETDVRGNDAFALAKSNLAVALFSRAQEIEADRIGLKIAVKAGFDPEGAVRFLMAMERAAKLRDGSDLDQLHREPSHPLLSDRIIYLQLNAEKYARQVLGQEEKAQYLANVDGLIFGEDTRRGSIRGRHVLFARLGFTVDVPEGFVVNSANETGSLVAADERGGRMLRVEVLESTSERSLSAYLSVDIVGDGRLYSAEEISINGYSAVTALGNDQQWFYRIYAVHADGAIYRFVFAAKHMKQEDEGAFRRSVETLRRVTAAEIEASNPPYLTMVTLEQGGASERVWEETAALHLPLERFLVLNDLEVGQLLARGDMVKIIAKHMAKRVSEIPTSDAPRSVVTVATTDQMHARPRGSCRPYVFQPRPGKCLRRERLPV